MLTSRNQLRAQPCDFGLFDTVDASQPHTSTEQWGSRAAHKCFHSSISFCITDVMVQLIGFGFTSFHAHMNLASVGIIPADTESEA